MTARTLFAGANAAFGRRLELDWTSVRTRALVMSSNRGAEAPLPRPAAPGGAVGGGTAISLSSQWRPTMTKTRKNVRTSSSKARQSRNTSKPKATVGSNSQGTAPEGEPKAPTKQQQLAALVVRDEGATLDQMIAATGWLPHTTRAALTGLKKKGYIVSSDKVDGVRTYRAVAPE